MAENNTEEIIQDPTEKQVPPANNGNGDKRPVVTKEQEAALDKLDFVTSNLGKIVSQNSQDKYFYTKPYSYDPTTTTNPNQNFERYYSHASFNKLGFNPWQDNETLYNEQGSAWGDIFRATISGAKMVPAGFKSAINSYGDVLKGDILAQDTESAAEMKRLNVIGSSSRGGLSGFASNLLTNVGYTVGLASEMASEAVVGALLTPETLGGSAGVAATSIALNFKNLGKWLNVATGFNKAVNSLKNFNVAKTAWEGFQAAGRFINPVSNTVEAWNASKNLTNLAKVSKTAAGFHKDVMLANATLSEAKVEGAYATSDLQEELVAQYYEDRGMYPQGADMEQIKKTAQEAGDKTLAWNIPVIMLTNKITFDPLFKRFVPMEDYITKAGTKFIEKKGTGFVKEGFGTGVKGLLKPKVYGRAGLSYFKENFSEGIQESLQEVISGTAKDYYKDIYKHPSKTALDQTTGENYTPDVSGILGKNVADQFSGQGFETFASGFFMGGLMKIQGGLFQAGREGYNKAFNKERYQEYKNRKDEYDKNTLTRLNDLYKDPLKYFGARIVNYGNSAATVDNQNDAADKDNKKVWQDVDDQAVWSHIMTALDTGTYDVFLDKLNNIKTMPTTAIQEAYGVDGQEVLTKISKVVERANYLKDSYEKWNNRASNPFNPNQFKKDTPEYEKEAIGYSAWEQAKKTAIFNGYSFDRNLERINSIRQDLSRAEIFDNAPATDITHLFDVGTINKELSLLKQEISGLKGVSGIGVKSDLTKKQKKFDKLQAFRSALENYFITQSGQGLTKEAQEELFGSFKKFEKTTDKQLKKAYKDYLKHVASQNGVYSLSDIKIDDSYKAIKDIHTLRSENRNLSATVNMLSNSKGFNDHYDRLNKVFSDMWKDKDKDLSEGLKSTYSRIELNNLLNNLFRLGYVVNEAEIAEISQGNIPEQFYSVVAKRTVTAGDRDYLVFKAIIEDFLSAQKGEPVQAEVKSADISDAEYAAFVDNAEVSAERLQSIADKITNNTPLSEREQAIFTARTTDINSLIQKQAEAETKEEVAPKKVIVPYDIQAKIRDIKTADDLINYENEIIGVLTNYDRTVGEGINNEVAQSIFTLIRAKEKSFVEAFDPKTLKKGDVVQMYNKDYDRMRVVRVSPTKVTLRKIGDNVFDLPVNKDELSKFIKFKYSETMTEQSPTQIITAEKGKAKENIETAEDLLNDNAALTELQEEAEKEGQSKVTDEFLKNLGCK